VTIGAGAGNINGGNDTLKVGLSDVGSPGTFKVQNYTTVDLFIPTNGKNTGVDGAWFEGANAGQVTFIDQPFPGVANAVVNIADTGGGVADDFFFGKVLNAALSNADIGVATVSIAGATGPTTINDTGHGRLLIGATDVTNLNAQSTSHLVMDLPATGGGVGSTPFPENSFLNHGITVHGSTGGSDLLQGSSGPLSLPHNTVLGTFISAVAADNLFGSNSGGDNIFGEGGNDSITLGAGHGANDTVWFGFYDEGNLFPSTPNVTVLQAVTDISGGVEIGVNGYLGVLSNVTTINNFQIGATGDIINIGSHDWVGSVLPQPLAVGFDLGLSTTTLGVIPFGNAHLFLGTTVGFIPVAATSLTLDGISTYADAGTVQAQLKLGGVGNINFGVALPAHDLVHELIAYSTGTQINIADLSILNPTGAATAMNTSNPALAIQVHDLIHITGQSSLGSLNPHDFVFHA
jgi:hypothetical protein